MRACTWIYPCLVTVRALTRLEADASCFRVALLGQVRQAGKLDHGRRPAHHGDGVLGVREEVLSHHLLADKACAVAPLHPFWHTVHCSMQHPPSDICIW